MKLKIGRWDVDVIATDGMFPNEQNTIDFLNQFINMFFHESDFCKENGYPNAADYMSQCGMDIYDALKAAGAYNFAHKET